MTRYGKLPETVESLTGGGGRHLLFQHPGLPIANDVDRKLGAGLDIRGDGGYIVVPPSSHVSGHCYEWEVTSGPDDVPLAPLPAWLLLRLQAPAPHTNGQPAQEGAPIPEGQRNSTLISLADTMRRPGMTPEEIAQALLVVNSRRCQPPLPTAEVEKIAYSVGRYAPQPETHADEDPAEESEEASTGRATTDASKPTIQISTAMTSIINTLQQAILALPKGPHLFQRARQLCIMARGTTPPKWLRHPTDAPVIIPMIPAHLRELAHRAATWQRYDQRRKLWEAVLPPVWAIETLYARPT